MDKDFLIAVLAAAFVVLSMTHAHAAQVWTLIDSQYSGREWYCTYQLSGTQITTQTVSAMPCAPSLFR